MAESFPAPGPYFATIGIRTISGMAFARAKGGLLITSRSATAYNSGPMVTGNLLPEEQDAWLAFLDKCVDQNLRVDWVNPRHVVPRSYTEASLPFAGTGALVSLTDLRTIVVSGLPVGLILLSGDRLSLSQGGKICHRKIADAVTVTSATNQTIVLTPRLPPGVFSAGADVLIKNPPLRLGIVPDSWEPRDAVTPTGLTFQVSEALA